MDEDARMILTKIQPMLANSCKFLQKRTRMLLFSDVFVVFQKHDT